MSNKRDILGIRFDDLSEADVQNYIKNTLKLKKSISVFTPNPQIALRSTKAPRLQGIINNSELVLPDGTGIIIASRLLGAPIQTRVTGIDVGEFLLSEAYKTGLGVFLLGGKAGVAEKAAKRLLIKYPGLNICGYHHGYFNKTGSENEKVIKKISDSNADIVIVCFGFPEQEKWIHRNRKKLSSVKIFAGLGGSIDVWAGNIKRAPQIFQKAGLEWLWRVMAEPSRYMIFFHIPCFLGLILKQKLTERDEKCHIF